MMKCPNCVTENKDNVKFCKGCGASLQSASSPTNQSSGAKNNNTLIICVALVLCVVVIGAVVLLSNGSDDSDSSVEVDNSDDVDSVDSSEDSSYSHNSLNIISGAISTGSNPEDKTYCDVFVGEQFAGEDVKISVLYKRDGVELNEGNIVPKTVDNNGYISVPSAYAFDKFPDKALITLYNPNGDIIDTKTVYLDESSGSQHF